MSDLANNAEQATPVVAMVDLSAGDVLFVDQRVFTSSAVLEHLAADTGCLVIVVRPQAGQNVTDCVMKMPFKAVQDLLKGATP